MKLSLIKKCFLFLKINLILKCILTIFTNKFNTKQPNSNSPDGNENPLLFFFKKAKIVMYSGKDIYKN
jgi:hypothetical protein